MGKSVVQSRISQTNTRVYFRSNAFASGGPKSRKIQFPPPLVTLLISSQFTGKKRAGNFLFVAWFVF